MPEPTTLLDEVTEIAEKAAIAPYRNRKGDGQVHYATDFARSILREIGDDTKLRSQNGYDRTQNHFQVITDKIASLKDDQVQELSRLVALDAIAANAVGSAERAAALSADGPKDQIKAFLQKYLTQAPDRTKAIEELGEKLHGKPGEKSDKLLLSFTHTMHPTIYHTPEARKFEKELTQILEAENEHNKKIYLLDGVSPPRLNEDGKKEVDKKFKEFIEKLAQGNAHISPKRPTTVSVETTAEKANLDIIREELKAVIKAWNAAVGELKLPETLMITPERAHEMLEFRTWGQSADADGREKSTSQFLYECIQNNLEDYNAIANDEDKRNILDLIKKQQRSDKTKVYDGFTMDVRQNAKEVHLPFMDALIQVKYRNSNDYDPDEKEKDGRYGEGSEFAALCEDFLKANREYEIRDPALFRFSMMRGFQKDSYKADHRAEFISDIIQRGSDTTPPEKPGGKTNRDKYRLIPEQIGVDAREFNEKIHPFKKEFLKKYEQQIRAKGYDPNTIDYMEMIKVKVPHPVSGKLVSLRGLWNATLETQGWRLSPDGLLYQHAKGEELQTDQEIRVHNFLLGAEKLNKSGEEAYKKGEKLNVSSHYEEISSQDLATFPDVAKRLFVINDAIDKYGPKVATRYQIANFSEPADFMILLKLFQDTGIAEIENGIVKKSKLAIQPLLETGEDLENAPAVFAALLKNPIARSFWEARDNEAEFMIGHSDGAASVGNFASEWKIYDTTRKLTKLFKAHSIKVRFFHGRGRGVNRGGTIDPSLHAELLPPEETQRGIYDVTIQSDLPMDLAASKAYGKDYFTRILLSTLKASLTAPQRISEAETLVPMEKAIDEIADNCGKRYEKFVRNNPEVLNFFNNTSDNPYKTSRNVSRDNGAKVHEKFDKIRAIPKEYLFNGIDLPVHNVGLRQAMDEYEALRGEQPDLPALGELNKHPFFKSVMQTIVAGMAHYDPTIARAHAKITNSEEFVDKAAIPHLDGLSEKLAELTSRPAWESGAIGEALAKNRKTLQPGERNQIFASSPWSSLLDQTAHGIIVSSIEKGKPAKPDPDRSDEKNWAETLYNTLFVTAQEIRNVQLPWQSRKPQYSLAV